MYGGTPVPCIWEIFHSTGSFTLWSTEWKELSCTSITDHSAQGSDTCIACEVWMAMELFESCLKRDEGGCVVAPRLSQTSCTTTVEGWPFWASVFWDQGMWLIFRASHAVVTASTTNLSVSEGGIQAWTAKEQISWKATRATSRKFPPWMNGGLWLAWGFLHCLSIKSVKNITGFLPKVEDVSQNAAGVCSMTACKRLGRTQKEETVHQTTLQEQQNVPELYIWRDDCLLRWQVWEVRIPWQSQALSHHWNILLVQPLQHNTRVEMEGLGSMHTDLKACCQLQGRWWSMLHRPVDSNEPNS